MTHGSATPLNPGLAAPQSLRVPTTREHIRRGLLVALLAVPLLGAAYWFFHPKSPHVRADDRRRNREALQSGTREQRKEAAWHLLERRDPIAESFLVQQLFGGEDEPDVREAYVYALGRLGNPQNAGAVEHALSLDPDGYVRAAAWLAAARLMPDRLESLLEQHADRSPVWDQIGMAQARFCVGDARGANVLLRFAVDGDAGQREVASRALTRWLMPALESLGRWPMDKSVTMGTVWPASLVVEIEQRCAEVDLQPAARQLYLLEKKLARARRHADRVLRVREGLADVLFSEEPEKGRSP